AAVGNLRRAHGVEGTMTGDHPGELELLDYVEAERSDPRLEAHLAECAECAEDVRMLRVARTAIRDAPLLELPPDRRARITDALPAPRERRRIRIPAGALVAAAALLLIAGAVALFATVGSHGGGGSSSSAGGSA